MDADHQHPHNKLKLRTVELMGLFHKFRLELVFFSNTHIVNGQKQICLDIFAIHKINSKERNLTFPLLALPWLREQMAEMLVKHDGTEQIE